MTSNFNDLGVNVNGKFNVCNCCCVGSIPSQKGFEENIGTAGILNGSIGKYMVVGGGANFPFKSALEKGEKVIHKDIYLVVDCDGDIKVLDQIQFTYPIAYGASCCSEDSVFYLATNPSKECETEILKVEVENEKLSVKIVGNIPFKLENIIAEYYDGCIYFGVGSINGKNSNSLYKYCLNSGEYSSLASFPGSLRNQCVSSVLKSFSDSYNLIVFGGGSSEAYVDGYGYDFENDTWSRLNDIVVDGNEVSVLGAGAVCFDDCRMIVVGGFNKELWKDAVYNLSNLKGDEHTKYRSDYFSMEPKDYKWNKNVLLFDFCKNEWSSLGEISFDAPCGNGLCKVSDKVYSIMGEIKPGIRTPNVYRIEF